MDSWSPSSWKAKPAAQEVRYADDEHLRRVLSKIATLPPLVTPSEIERLKYQLSQVQQGNAFLLHAGDCAESFDACTNENVTAKIGLILSFSLILIWGARTPVVRIGRIAGQYAKPRSSPTEKVGNKSVPSFRGDNVNSLDPEDRAPNPDRLLSAYFHSAATLNYIRALLASGFASLNHPRDWSLSHVRSATLKKEFEEIATNLSDALDFSRTIGIETGSESAVGYERGGGLGTFGAVDLYTSHEGLMLDYEQALTRKLRNPLPESKEAQSYYNTSTHFLWIGDRTRQITGAHIEYFRGIKNPIGIKVGPSMENEELVRVLDILNPDRESGRISLITRYGAGKIERYLGSHIEAVQQSGHPVIWVCDPMHGNTVTSSSGLKTRQFRDIIEEIIICLRIHEQCGSRLGGVSLEFTGELNEEGFSVTECLGGSMELTEDELGLRYQSFCDPRLNFEQSLDVAFLISKYLKERRTGGDRSPGKFSALGNRNVVYDTLAQT